MQTGNGHLLPHHHHSLLEKRRLADAISRSSRFRRRYMDRLAPPGVRAMEQPEEAEFQALLEGFRENGLPLREITLQELNGMCFTLKAFTKLTRILVGYAEQGHLMLVFNTANQHTTFTNIFSPGITELRQCCAWLKTPKGQDVMRVTFKAMKVKKRATTVVTAEDAGWVAILEAQLADRTKAEKKIRMRLEHEIQQLELSLRQKRQQLVDEVEASNKHFKSATSYKIPPIKDEIQQLELSLIQKRQQLVDEVEASNKHFKAATSYKISPIKELRRRAFKKYVDERVSAGEEAPVLDDDSVRYAADLYGMEVMTEVKAEFCRETKVRKNLKRYCERKIRGFERMLDVRQVSTFRGYLVAATGEDIAPVATPPPSSEDEGGADREAELKGPSPHFLKFFGLDTGSDRAGQEDEGDKGYESTSPRRRASAKCSGSAGTKSKSPSRRRYRTRSRKPYSPGA